ncbi:MAG: hypothetical protein KDE27_04110 [Planctomycetes bacterium]|nr:hypothetical protein [Planctomycetota bacterium]
MQRPAALARQGALLVLCAASACRVGERAPTPPRDLVASLLAQNDAAMPARLAAQQLDPMLPHHGGIPSADGVWFPGATSGFIRDLVVAWVSPASRYHRSARLLAALDAAATYMLDVQHADGTIDLPTTNFHSPPDTGFVLEWMCAAAAVLRATDDPAAGPVLEKLLRFIRRGADALAVGGIHTPNHRWVVCMALARANALIPDPRYLARIDSWLAENIDIDADGQFTERSTTIYSPLTDRCLITVARLLGRPELLEPVRANLAMTLYYMHADGSVATEGSRRQDQYQHGSLLPYYYPYRFLAQRDGDARFAAIAHRLEAEQLPRLTGQLVYLLESPELARPMPEPGALPDDYERHFAHSGLVRIRRGTLSATILADNPTFFSLHVGSAAVAMRFASAFFGKGQFVGGEFHRDGADWVLSQDLTGPYYQPIPAALRRADGDWLAMDRDARPTSEVQQLHSAVRVRERDDGFDVEVAITGTDGVPVAIEFGCPAGTEVTGAVPIEGADSAWLVADGATRLTVGGDHIELRGGEAGHRWTRIRGALDQLPGRSVYATGFTPWHRTIEFRRGR